MYMMAKSIGPDAPGTAMVQRSVGLGCACGCNKGMGLFESGMDYTQWGLVEWGIVVVGGYMVLSTIFTTKRVAGKIRALPGERRKSKAAKLRARAKELSRPASSHTRW